MALNAMVQQMPLREPLLTVEDVAQRLNVTKDWVWDHSSRKALGLPKLTFQVIRRTIATLAQKKGTVKDVQGVLRHSRTATTTDVYMQEIPESVQATVNSIHSELRPKSASRGAQVWTAERRAQASLKSKERKE
jgi:integrase